MKIIKIDLEKPQKKQIDEIVDYFKKGKTVLYPADTVYGLGCIITDEKAIKKIHKIKKTKESKLLLLLASSISMVNRFFYINKRQVKYASKRWPGPFSLKFKCRDEKLLKRLGAVRIPKGTAGQDDKDFIIKVIRKVGEPIISTSANITGHETLADVSDVESYFKNVKPDLVVDVGRIKNRKSSQVVDIRDMDDIKVLRK